MVNGHWQHDGNWDLVGDTLLGVRFSKRHLTGGGKTHHISGWYHPMGQNPSLDKMRKDAAYQWPSGLPDYIHNVISITQPLHAF